LRSKYAHNEVYTSPERMNAFTYIGDIIYI